MTEQSPKEPKGEGSYTGAKQYRDAQHKFAKDGPVIEKAREAAIALDGSEAQELEKARSEAAKGKPTEQNARKNRHGS